LADEWDPESVPFIAPEVRAGGGGDPRSDIYTVGTLLYFALTGQVPATDPGEIVPPHQLRPMSPQALDRILMRTLQQDPGQRFFSAAEMIADLLSELGNSDILIPVAPQRTAYEDAGAWEKHLRRLLGDDYELLDELGFGGFGRVYRVRDLELEREVALKILHPFLTTDPTVVERFRREAQVAARVVHVNIVNTYEIGGRGGLLWYTMEYVPGGNLAQAVEKDGRLPVERVVRLMQEALGALRHAHGYGLVHRDIKPENILLDGSGGVRIADFGLALALQRPDWHGGASSRSGTPEFAAPEQMLGEPVDHRADLYSLTLCAYFALTGSVPFRGGTPAVIVARHAMGRLPDLAAVRGDLPDGLVQTLVKGAALEPSDRFDSAEQYAQAIAESMGPASTSPLERLRRFVRGQGPRRNQ
jgi:serine/threonine protein kinase